MNILIISTGNEFSYYKGNFSPHVKGPVEALRKIGINIDVFQITSRGLRGYMQSIPKLKIKLKEKKFDIIHAHYGLCGIIAAIVRKREKLVVSYMGTDLLGMVNNKGKYTFIGWLYVFLNKIIASFFNDNSIVKAQIMKTKLWKKSNVSVIPNGVNLKVFYPIKQEEAKKKLNILLEKKIILFIGDSNGMPVKNIKLAYKAIDLLDINDIEFRIVSGVSQEELNYYYNSASLLLLTSFHEGSPNVIKEAMATNCPIVSTAVGDVPELIKDIDGCFVCNHNEQDIADKIYRAISFENRTFGRDRLINLKLKIEDTANSIIHIYKEILTN